ncbi:probable cytochrome P450 6d5 [Sitodiplosis mosellana]|uniref:probable cytochrome P450 6d5 n=1 Tax=Sitodiplosis mosellana TaxID=263140 RepID=UPI002443A347|nr:probable cytochrome P450 6d5 [Sitodiplosis mosellana]
MLCCLLSSTALAVYALSLLSIYFYVKYLYSYWQRCGVPYVTPSFPFGNFGKNFMQKTTLCEQVDEYYRNTTEPFIGMFGMFRPTLVVCDPELARNILIKDFNNFSDHGVYVDEANDPISAHLFALQGAKWKNLRLKLTPTFTSGKMRAIFSTLLDCTNPLQNYMEKVAESGEIVEFREVTACYLTNAIASVAFGIDIDCFADPDNAFRKYGRQMFDLTKSNAFRFLCFNLNPNLLKWSGMHFLDREVENFLFDVVRQTLELREKNNIVRKDFFQLLVQLRNSGTVQLDDDWQTVITNDNNKSLSFEEIVAQSFVFFAAGFETSSGVMSFCLYEVAKSPEIQRKIQDEIDTVLAQHNGQFTYESINELKYLECCIDETLRKYPVVPILTRQCTKEYKIPGSNVTIEKGTSVFIPAFSLQRDEKYYQNPDKFDPLRFSYENRNGKTIVDMPYFPFGAGPRTCIGLRMGKMSTIVGIASILQKYNVELGEQHIGEELEFSPASVTLAPTTGINLKIQKRHI